MSLTISESQRDLLAPDHAIMVTLIKHELFSDYVAKTVAETFYWSHPFPVYYNYGGTPRIFRHRLRAVSPIVNGFSHIPDPSEFDIRDVMELEFDASGVAGEFLWQRLTDLNLIGSQVEISTLLVPTNILDLDRYWDLTSLDEDHKVRFRGEVTRAPELNDRANAFAITCETVEPSLDWVYVTNPTADPKDLGKRIPVIAGDAKRVPLINYDVGTTGVVSEDMNRTQNTVFLTDVSEFAAPPFDIVVDAERMTVTTVNVASSSLIAQRGSAGTKGIEHRRGAVASTIQDTLLVVSSQPVSGIDALYLSAPETNDLVRISPADYSEDSNDTVTIPGRTISSVAITADELFNILKGLEPPEVATQPTFADPAVTVDILNKNFSSGSRSTSPSLVQTNCTAGDSGSDLLMSGVNGAQLDGVWYWNDGDLGTLSDPVNRFRVHIEYSVTNPNNELMPFRFRMRSSFGNIFFSATVAASANGTAAGTYISDWFTPPAGTTVDDFSNGALGFSTGGPHLAFNISNVPHVFGRNGLVISSGSKIEIESLAAGGALVQTGDVTLDVPAGEKSGFGLDFFADVRGAGLEAETDLQNLDADSGNWTPTPTGTVGVSDAGIGLEVEQLGGGSGELLDFIGSAGDWLNVVSSFWGDATFAAAGDALGVEITQVPADSFPTTNGAMCYVPLDAPTEIGPDSTGAITLTIDIASQAEIDDNYFLVALAENADHAGAEWRWNLQSLLSVGVNNLTLNLGTGNGGSMFGASGIFTANYFNVQFAGEDGESAHVLRLDGQLDESGINVTNVATRTVAVDVSGQQRVEYGLDISAADLTKLSTESTGLEFILADVSGSESRWRVLQTSLASGTNAIAHPLSSPDSTVGGGVDLATVTSMRWQIKWIDVVAGRAISFSTITQTAVDFVTHPADVARIVLTTLAGLDDDVVDNASFNQALVNVPNVSIAGDLRRAGVTLAELLANIGFEGRINFVRREDDDKTRYYALSPPSFAFEWGYTSPGINLFVFDRMRSTLKALDERANQLQALFEFRNLPAFLNVELYRQVIVVNEETNDLELDGVPTALITAAQLQVGPRPAGPTQFNFLVDRGSAVEVFRYYAFENFRTNARVYTLLVPLSDGYTLEPGDVGNAYPRWVGSPTYRKVRITNVALDPEEPVVALSCIEVP